MSDSIKLSINTDGGSRGNPGPAASAFVIHDGVKTIHESALFLGPATNNVAEYQGLIIALDYLLTQSSLLDSVTALQFFLDSELIVRQVTGIYKVKHPQILPLFSQVKQRLALLKTPFSFTHVPRDQNARADFLVNQELDLH